MADQLALDVRLPDSASFENFFDAGNRELVQALRAQTLVTIYLYGPAAAGKTHLLQALVRAAQARRVPAVYCGAPALPAPDALADKQVVCIDDAHTLIGDAAGEHFLFNAYEAARERGAVFALAANQPLDGLSFRLPDLKSRLRAGLVYRVHPLDDAHKAQAVRLRARNRGFEMADDVVQYVLRRYPRDMRSLFELLDRIDVLSLQQQRRVTVPFIRELIG